MRDPLWRANDLQTGRPCPGPAVSAGGRPVIRYSIFDWSGHVVADAIDKCARSSILITRSRSVLPVRGRRNDVKAVRCHLTDAIFVAVAFHFFILTFTPR